MWFKMTAGDGEGQQWRAMEDCSIDKWLQEDICNDSKQNFSKSHNIDRTRNVSMSNVNDRSKFILRILVANL